MTWYACDCTQLTSRVVSGVADMRLLVLTVLMGTVHIIDHSVRALLSQILNYD